ncbi:DNA repair protein RecN [hydrothermal vent metagenome]|uniref:DNA repair protein RecN n=1 Tax=hydrothermal vent metagenome TaxID=652676 RepID=A0A3B0ZQW3_9ZZZZ
MLTYIHIWNFAVVEKLDVEINDGLTIVTGETGAGKSIMLDALGLSLGDRADSSIVRHGCDKAEISVSFSTADTPDAESWLVEHEMNSENECIIRRSINDNGTSKAFINGIPSPIKLLRELGEKLVDLHGQHEHQSLLKADLQRLLLDDYAKNQKTLDNIKHAFKIWQQLNNEYQRLTQASKDRTAQLDLLRYQVDELETLSLAEGEVKEIEVEHKRLANANQLLSSSDSVLRSLMDDENINLNHILNKSITELDTLSKLDEAIKPANELLRNALINIEEATSELRNYSASLEIDPQRLELLEQRLADIQNLSRKHNVSNDTLHTLLPRLADELDTLQNADVRLGNLESEIQQAANTYLNVANELTKKRQTAAKKLSKRVTASMQTLGMEGGKFEVACNVSDDAHYSAFGADTIEFLVSANPGQSLKPLAKVASGGELSRISLAINVITAKDTRIPTLVFDEVDVGIGGRVAEIVGRELRALSEHSQVLCVTHLPQVAALGHHHLQVNKTSDKNVTTTQITHLSKELRIEEIARMLGGLNITEQTRSHAKEMIEQAEKPAAEKAMELA